MIFVRVGEYSYVIMNCQLAWSPIYIRERCAAFTIWNTDYCFFVGINQGCKVYDTSFFWTNLGWSWRYSGATVYHERTEYSLNRFSGSVTAWSYYCILSSVTMYLNCNQLLISSSLLQVYCFVESHLTNTAWTFAPISELKSPLIAYGSSMHFSFFRSHLYESILSCNG